MITILPAEAAAILAGSLLLMLAAAWIGYRSGSRQVDDDDYWQPVIPDEPPAPAPGFTPARPPWVEYPGPSAPAIPRQVPAWARPTMPGRAVPPPRPRTSPKHAATAPRITNRATSRFSGARRLMRRLR
jgi:hypothetical protein